MNRILLRGTIPHPLHVIAAVHPGMYVSISAKDDARAGRRCNNRRRTFSLRWIDAPDIKLMYLLLSDIAPLSLPPHPPRHFYLTSTFYLVIRAIRCVTSTRRTVDDDGVYASTTRRFYDLRSIRAEAWKKNGTCTRFAAHPFFVDFDGGLPERRAEVFTSPRSPVGFARNFVPHPQIR